MAAGGSGTDRERQVDAQILRYTVRRGERVGVSKEDYLRELSKTLQGIRYSELEASLDRLKVRALVSIDLLGVKDFVVRPTQQAVESFGSSRVTERAWDEASKSPIPCPKCGETMPPTSKVCGVCGFSFASIVTAAGAGGNLSTAPTLGPGPSQAAGHGRRTDTTSDGTTKEWERLRTKERLVEEREAESRGRIAEQEKKFEAKKSLLDGMMRELEIAEVEMEKREQELRVREKKAGDWVKSAQSQVAKEATLAVNYPADGALKKGEEELQRQTAELERREESVDAREGSLLQRMSSLQEMESAMKERERLLDERESRLRSWADDLTRKHKDLSAQAKQARPEPTAGAAVGANAIGEGVGADKIEEKKPGAGETKPEEKPKVVVGPPPAFKK